MLIIDGSRGEGGGQVLRTCLALSALTGRPFRIEAIRANRSRPGLRPQHLTAVRAAAAICRARVEGDAPDSTVLLFEPRTAPQAGEYEFDVAEASPSRRSAGSVTLILQAILWPLLFAGGASRISLRGGTFVPYSPPFHYLAEVALPSFARMGVRFAAELNSWGWMDAGGGSMSVTIEPSAGLQAAQFEPGSEKAVHGLAAVTNLPSHIPHRMARRAHNLLLEAGLEPEVQPLRERGAGAGAGITQWMRQAGFSGLGRKGLPADKVAEAAVAKLLAFLDNGAAVDHHLADQLLVPMALARGQSGLTTGRLTQHAVTVGDLLGQWFEASVGIVGSLEQPASITVQGVAFGQSG
jgi:RNA 3'-terminal phosphate cyclase (ATP)